MYVCMYNSSSCLLLLTLVIIYNEFKHQSRRMYVYDVLVYKPIVTPDLDHFPSYSQQVSCLHTCRFRGVFVELHTLSLHEFDDIDQLHGCRLNSNLSLLPSDPTDQPPREVLPRPVGGRRRIPLHIKPHPLRQEQTAAGRKNVALRTFMLCLFVVYYNYICNTLQ